MPVLWIELQRQDATVALGTLAQTNAAIHLKRRSVCFEQQVEAEPHAQAFDSCLSLPQRLEPLGGQCAHYARCDWTENLDLVVPAGRRSRRVPLLLSAALRHTLFLLQSLTLR